MHKQVARIVSVFILGMIIIISVSRVSDFLQMKESDNRYASFFAEKNQIEVIFLGSSHVRHGFFPMELWNDYGITSYNLAGNGNTIPISYWTLVNALDYQTPKVVVMDIFDMWPGRKIGTSWGMVHTSLDAFPMSIHKYQMVRDLIDDKNMTAEEGDFVYDKRWELLFDLGEYHTRWGSIEEGDFDNQSKLEANSAIWRGASPLIEISARNEYIYTENNNLCYDETAKDYLERMIQLCADKNVDLLLINTGYDCNDEAKYFADSVNEIAGQYEIPYIDFTDLDIINFESDLHSSGHNTHINFSGAEKFTSFIGQILSGGGQYRLSDYRNDVKSNSRWSDHQAFVNSKADYLREQSSLDLYLMFLADDDYNIIIEILDKSILSETNNRCMIENLGINVKKLNGNSNLVAVDMSNREVSYISNNYESDSSWISVLGELCLKEDLDGQQGGDTGAYGMYLNGQRIYTTRPDESVKIRITVINRGSGEMVDVHTF